MYRSFNDVNAERTAHSPGGSSPIFNNESTCTSSCSAAPDTDACRGGACAVSLCSTPTPTAGHRAGTVDTILTLAAAGPTRGVLLNKVLDSSGQRDTPGTCRAVGRTVPHPEPPHGRRFPLPTDTIGSVQPPHRKSGRHDMSMQADRVYQPRHKTDGIYGQGFSHYQKHLPVRPSLSFSHGTPLTHR